VAPQPRIPRLPREIVFVPAPAALEHKNAHTSFGQPQCSDGSAESAADDDRIEAHSGHSSSIHTCAAAKAVSAKRAGSPSPETLAMSRRNTPVAAHDNGLKASIHPVIEGTRRFIDNAGHTRQSLDVCAAKALLNMRYRERQFQDGLCVVRAGLVRHLPTAVPSLES
jgi:hypothetical protein